MESTSARNAQRKVANEDGKRHPNGEVDTRTTPTSRLGESRRTRENGGRSARTGSRPTSRPKRTDATRREDAGRATAHGGSRVLPANRAVGHTDEVNTTNRVTLFAGAATGSRPFLRVNPR